MLFDGWWANAAATLIMIPIVVKDGEFSGSWTAAKW
jgi:hypothetical protein